MRNDKRDIFNYEVLVHGTSEKDITYNILMYSYDIDLRTEAIMNMYLDHDLVYGNTIPYEDVRVVFLLDWGDAEEGMPVKKIHETTLEKLVQPIIQENKEGVIEL